MGREMLTVKTMSCPSVVEAGCMVTIGRLVSLSCRFTVAVGRVPCAYPLGRVSKPSRTLSPSSSSESSVAVTVNVRRVCPAVNVMLAGTPE